MAATNKPRRETVSVELTLKQAEVLHALLAGEMDRWSYLPKTMRSLNQIGKRLCNATGWRWHDRWEKEEK